ncbi:MAG: preprotein translocase subunit SecE [Clostridia bacterium]|nr:preprotein translocase subunit SecE [Clostridia bacterium]MBR0435934.1 preprotein translocase subunit SecE [Clostridia bacterium]MBR2644603.1 preprotein translocase subunit SecE [Clostridia bacterium]MBR3038328.1 preprotein translocase subunit SecE [Clostridia bacterium]MBR3130290.1 preprotein translocase subunit SecE [Clostridia bacterium]
MANVQDMKAQKAVKTLRLVTILLLVVGIVAFAASMFDMFTGSKLLKLFDAAATETDAAAVDPNHGGQTVAYVLLAIGSGLLVAGAIFQLVKNDYRKFQAFCIAAIIFALYPLIFFAVNIGTHLFALIFALLTLAIIVLAIIAMKSRWQVYLKEMTGEVKKLTWLSWKELVKATAVVLVFVLAFALLIYVLDLIFYTPVKAALNHTPETATTTSDEPTGELVVGDSFVING